MWNALKQARRLAQESFTRDEMKEILQRAAELQSQAEQLPKAFDQEAIKEGALAAGIRPEFLEQAIREFKIKRQRQIDLKPKGQGVGGFTDLWFWALIPLLGFPAFLLLLYAAFSLKLVGVMLLLVALGLFAKSFIVQNGFLTAAGIFALLLGGYLLFSDHKTALASLILMGLLIGGLVGAALIAILKAQRRKPEVGREWLIGQVGEARTDLTPTGVVFVGGTLWTAEAVNGEVKAGEAVEVVAIDGLRLEVMRYKL